MIVVTLGTIFFPFDRAVIWLQELLDQEIIKEKVLLQHGSTSVARLTHPLLTDRASLPREEMYKYIQQSSLVISHAGQGSTRMLVQLGASFVLLPRLKQYGEHVDNHQLLFAKAMARFGIPYCTKFEHLVNYIKHPPEPIERKIFEGPSLAEYLASNLAR